VGPALGACGGAAAMAVLPRLPPRWYAARMGTLLVVLSLCLVFLPFTRRAGETRWEIGPAAVSPFGVERAAVLLFKGMALLTLLLAAAVTAPMDVHLKALHALRVP